MSAISRKNMLIPIIVKPIILIGLLNFSFILYAQVNDKAVKNDESLIEDRIENIAENTDTELDYTELAETLNYFKENPVNLNNTNAEELKKLIFLDDLQINDLLNYIANNGQLQTVYELHFVNGFNNSLIYKILPYIIVEKMDKHTSLSFKDIFKYGKNSILLRYQITTEKQLGYASASDTVLVTNPNQRYLGNAAKIFTRYAFNYKDVVKFGFTADKDPGEEFFKGSQPNGFDFYSAYAAIKNIGVVKSLVIGDFQVQFGQGLVLWTGLGMGKSSSAINLKKFAQGIKPYASANETGFLRGAGLSLGFKNIDISVFYSNKKNDANLIVSDTLSQENQYITSLQQTGYHRTSSELSDKNVMRETLIGSHLSFKHEYFKIGATVYHSVFSIPLNKETAWYHKFDFQGKENTVAGIDYNYLSYPFLFFGESALSSGGGMAFVNGLQVKLDPRFALSMIYRSYQKEYQNLKSAAFGENSLNANEKGLFTGVEVGISAKWTAFAYVDFYTFPWLKYLTDAPSNGSEYLLKLNYHYSRRLELYFQYRQKNRMKDAPSAFITKYVENVKKQNLRLNIAYTISDNLSIQNRIEFVENKYVSGDAHHGFLIYQDLSYQFKQLPLRLSTRYALFDTDTYDDRLYAYESDVLYAFSVAASYYKGSRFYIMAKLDLNNSIDIWLRYSVSYYNNKKTISSGLDEIQGSSKSEIKMQLMMKF
jgi:DNA uptake protein ComE-like DNA-binding protein